MKFDAVTSLKVVNNQRMMVATHRGEYRELGGALALTSDLTHPRFNCLEGFTTDIHRLESLLDVGFSLLRAFDRPASVRLSPLDLPANIGERLARRGLIETGRDVAMVLGDDPAAAAGATGADIRIVRCDPENASAWATLHLQAAGLPSHVKPLLLGATLANVLDPDHAFYMASAPDDVDGQYVATLLAVREAETTGLYSIATLKSYRRRGIATALSRRAIADAGASGATCICLEVASDNAPALRLYEALGFRAAHETVQWVERGG